MGIGLQNQFTQHHRGFCIIFDWKFIFNLSMSKTLQRLLIFSRHNYFFENPILAIFLVELRSLRFFKDFARVLEKDTAHACNMGRKSCVKGTGRNLQNHPYTINTLPFDCLQYTANSDFRANKKQGNLRYAQ